MNRRTFMKAAPLAVVAIPASNAKAAKPMRRAITRRQLEALRREIAYAAGRGLWKITDIARIEREIAQALGVPALGAITPERYADAIQKARRYGVETGRGDAHIFDMIEARAKADSDFMATAEETPEADAALDRFNDLTRRIAEAKAGTVQGYAAKLAIVADGDGLEAHSRAASALLAEARALSGIGHRC